MHFNFTAAPVTHGEPRTEERRHTHPVQVSSPRFSPAGHTIGDEGARWYSASSCHIYNLWQDLLSTLLVGGDTHQE